jgi:hypothetical protein
MAALTRLIMQFWVRNGSSRRAFYFHSGETSAAVVTGLTITNGYANYGGAIQNDYCSPTVAGCTFAVNNASWSGGAMSNFFATPAARRCIFSGNSGDSARGQEFI